MIHTIQNSKDASHLEGDLERLRSTIDEASRGVIFSELDTFSPERIAVIAETPHHLGKKRKWMAEIIDSLLGDKK